MDELEKRGKKLSIGKACIRFKRLEDLPLDLVGEAIAYKLGGGVHRDIRDGPQGPVSRHPRSTTLEVLIWLIFS